MKTTVLVRRAELHARKASPAFVHALRVARAINSIRFILDHATHGRHEDSVEAMRARYSGGILLAAAVYELLYVLDDHAFRRALAEADQIAPLLELADHPVTKMLKRGYLARLRNKLAFHYVGDHIKTALRETPPDPTIVLQIDDTPGATVFYAVPEVDVLLSIPDDEVPQLADVQSLQKAYPFTHLLELPPGELKHELRRYFECLNAVMIVAFALAHLADKMLIAQFREMGAQSGGERDEGSLETRPEMHNGGAS